jgi:hypothetical protein
MCDLRYVCLFAYGGVQHILCCVFVLFVFTLCLVYQKLPVSLDGPFLIVLLHLSLCLTLFLTTFYRVNVFLFEKI